MALSLIIQRRLTPQMSGLICSGIPGRFETESVAVFVQNTQNGLKLLLTSEAKESKSNKNTVPVFNQKICELSNLTKTF